MTLKTNTMPIPSMIAIAGRHTKPARKHTALVEAVIPGRLTF
jgi:hypothetical protein